LKKDEIFIRHIFDEINFIMDKSKGLKYENLMKDETLKRAFLRSPAITKFPSHCDERRLRYLKA